MTRARTRIARRGFTLIELLIVMSLVALMLGLGVGMFANLDVGGRVAVGAVQNVLRSAHNWAVARSAPARVLVDPASGTMHAEGRAVVGTWHFESDALDGAFGLDGVKLGGQIVEDGFEGRALSFAGEPARSRVEVPVHLDPSYDLSHGFSIRCAVRPADLRGGSLIALGDVAGLETGGDGSVRAWFVAERPEGDTRSGRGARVVIRSEPGLLRPERWSILEFAYDRATVSIRVDGQTVAWVDEDAPVARLAGPLVISPSETPFPGTIDALVVTCTSADEVAELTPTIAFAKGTPREIVFQAGGGLDRERHREPVRIELEFDDGHKETVQVNLYGTVE